MRNMEAVGMAALAPQHLKRTQRLSTIRRIARLEVLLDEMKVRELTHYDVADFLMCSLSSARNYMLELLDAGLLSAVQHGQERRNRDETPYRVSANTRVVEEFIASRTLNPVGRVSMTSFRNSSAERSLAVRGDPRSTAAAREFPATRDPLVAALFGCRSSVEASECSENLAVGHEIPDN